MVPILKSGLQLFIIHALFRGRERGREGQGKRERERQRERERVRERKRARTLSYPELLLLKVTQSDLWTHL